jgi:hypothetical protein
MQDDPLTIDMLRSDITIILGRLAEYIPGVQLPVVQELVLTQRHLEDARMRLGVAECYEKGVNPWINKVEPKR